MDAYLSISLCAAFFHLPATPRPPYSFQAQFLISCRRPARSLDCAKPATNSLMPLEYCLCTLNLFVLKGIASRRLACQNRARLVLYAYPSAIIAIKTPFPASHLDQKLVWTSPKKITASTQPPNSDRYRIEPTLRLKPALLVPLSASL